MPITVTLPDSLTEKMQTVAIPLKDTHLSVIERAVDALIEKMNGGTFVPAPATPQASGPTSYPADAPPSLTFTRPMSIILDGVQMGKKDLFWNLFLFKVIAKAATTLKGQALQQALLVNFVEGENTTAGYRYIKEAGLSVQGADANYAWKATIHLIKIAGMKVDVTFRWDANEGAAHPGQVGRMTY